MRSPVLFFGASPASPLTGEMPFDDVVAELLVRASHLSGRLATVFSNAQSTLDAAGCPTTALAQPRASSFSLLAEDRDVFCMTLAGVTGVLTECAARFEVRSRLPELVQLGDLLVGGAPLDARPSSARALQRTFEARILSGFVASLKNGNGFNPAPRGVAGDLEDFSVLVDDVAMSVDAVTPALVAHLDLAVGSLEAGVAW